MESMKKFLFVLAFVGLSSYALAQTSEVPTKKYSVATNSFWSNWFIQVGADWNAFPASADALASPVALASAVASASASATNTAVSSGA